MYTFNFDVELESLGDAEYCALLDCEVDIEGMVDGGFELLAIRLYDDHGQLVDVDTLPQAEQNYVTKLALDRAERYGAQAVYEAVEAEVDARYSAWKDGSDDKH